MSAQNGNGQRTDHWPAPNERRILEGTERPSGFALGVPTELIEAIAEAHRRVSSRSDCHTDRSPISMSMAPPSTWPVHATGSMTCVGTVA